jgi:hypothetical protein
VLDRDEVLTIPWCTASPIIHIHLHSAMLSAFASVRRIAPRPPRCAMHCGAISRSWSARCRTMDEALGQGVWIAWARRLRRRELVGHGHVSASQ